MILYRNAVLLRVFCVNFAASCSFLSYNVLIYLVLRRFVCILSTVEFDALFDLLCVAKA